MLCLCCVVRLAVKNCGVMTKLGKAKFCDATRHELIGIMITVQQMAIKSGVCAVTI